jgi:hypothetical protein
VIALDLTQAIRNVKRYQAWTALDFENPSTGKYLASRAATEDVENGVTLSINSVINVNTKQCEESMEAIFKMKDIFYKRIEKESVIEIDIDGNSLSLPGKTFAVTGEQFLFFSFNKPFPTNYFLRGKTVLMNVKGIGLANFSLYGFGKAYLDAQNRCKQHQLDQQPFSSSLPLSTTELTCRLLGAFVEQYATQRDQGVSITDALMALRRWVADAGHPPAIQALHERLLLSVYQDTWLTPLRARQQFETACVIQVPR